VSIARCGRDVQWLGGTRLAIQLPRPNEKAGSIIRATKTLQPQASTGVNFADPANQKAIT